MSHTVGIIFDPTVLFVLGCLSVGPALEYMQNPSGAVEKIIEYVKDPAIVSGFGVLLVGILYGGSWKKGFTGSERRLALWYLINGAFIHVTMDGMTGGWHFLELLNNHYINLDKRFAQDEAVSWLITQLELWLMAPLCILTYAAIVKRSPSRYLLEIITSLFQLAGAIFFFGSEVVNIWFRSPHLHHIPNIPVDWDLSFDFHDCLYFWFGFGANLIWVVIPLIFILRSFFAARALIAKASPSAPSASPARATKPKTR